MIDSDVARKSGETPVTETTTRLHDDNDINNNNNKNNNNNNNLLSIKGVMFTACALFATCLQHVKTRNCPSGNNESIQSRGDYIKEGTYLQRTGTKNRAGTDMKEKKRDELFMTWIGLCNSLLRYKILLAIT